MSPSTELRLDNAPDLQVVVQCRACGNSPLEHVLSLGSTPLANSLVSPQDTTLSPLYPLNLVRCPRCALVQLGEIVSPKRLFSEYVYYSSFSDTMLAHAEQLASELIINENLGSRSLVVELASNDGYLLQFFKQRGIPVLGIEPAKNIAEFAEREKSIPTVAEFFDEQVALQLAASGQRADVIIGNNVLAHVPDLNGFIAGVALLLTPDGTAIFEVPYLKDMLDRVEFDTIYHEHQCYFSLTALASLFKTHGLDLWQVRRQPIHGGSLRIYAAPAGRRSTSSQVTTLLSAEAAWGVSGEAAYRQFASAVDSVKLALVSLLHQLRASAGPLAGYGAAAKGVTLLSYCGIGGEYLDFLVDRSTYKQGKLFPVDALPIYAPEALLERHPAYTLLLTWNFATEILRQQSEYLARGGCFVVPVPSPRLVPARD